MFVDEAVLQLEMSHRQFLVFLNARSSSHERPLPPEERRFRFDRAGSSKGLISDCRYSPSIVMTNEAEQYRNQPISSGEQRAKDPGRHG